MPNYQPTWILNSLYDLTPEILKQKGFTAMIVDLDNTLLAWNVTRSTKEATHWIQTMQNQEIRLFILSNNTTIRVQQALEGTALPYRASALKPSKKSFQAAIKALDVPISQILVVGDQLFTDIVGANRVGLASVLVKPLAEHDIIYTRLSRWLEKCVLRLKGIQRHTDWGNTLD